MRPRASTRPKEKIRTRAGRVIVMRGGEVDKEQKRKRALRLSTECPHSLATIGTRESGVEGWGGDSD
jgi:hypothetical protein